MSVQTKVWTEAELLALPGDRKYEVVEGELIMSPAGFMGHGRVIALLSAKLTIHVQDRKLGITSDGQSGCWMKSGNLRCPNISFLSKLRAMPNFEQPSVFLQGAPDLTVEVLSPNEPERQIREKLMDYFESGSRLVWILNLADKTVEVYHSNSNSKVLRIGDSLDGEDVIPGFSMPVAELFATPSFE